MMQKLESLKVESTHGYSILLIAKPIESCVLLNTFKIPEKTDSIKSGIDAQVFAVCQTACLNDFQHIIPNVKVAFINRNTSFSPILHTNKIAS